MRYKVTVTDDHLVSLQITTSKTDVYLKFVIYDNGEEILSVHGKGTAVIPAFIFLKDREAANDTNATSRPPSKTCKYLNNLNMAFYFIFICWESLILFI
jgi:hypothetical protein